MTPVAIFNLALVKLGSAPIQTFNDATPMGTAAAQIYPEVVNGVLAEYPWNFCKKTVQLNQLNETPLADNLLMSGWQFAFALPAGIIGMPARMLANNRYPDGPETRWELQGSTIYTNQNPIYAVGQYYVDEASWPAWFIPAVVACLMAETCLAVTGYAPMRDTLMREAWGTPDQNRMGGKLGIAKQIDSRNQPSRVLTHNPLIDARVATIGVIPTGATFP